MKRKTSPPTHCKGCGYFHNAGQHRWCCHFGTRIEKALALCIAQGFRKAQKEQK